MSGGQLAVLDRLGREVKQYELPSGLATLGSSSACDIRFMLPTVEPHHATIVVHDKQTVVHNVGSGETLVNGTPVSVVPLMHGDVLAVGGRELRWRYARPGALSTAENTPTALTPAAARMSGVRARVAARRSLAGQARAPRSPQRHSTPANARQVAVVQPQRRPAADNTAASVPSASKARRRGTARSDQDTSSSSKSEEAKGRSKAAKSPQMNLQNTTKASMWIESRKTSPRKHAKESPGPAQRRARSAKKSTPLRLAVLRRAQSAHRPPPARVTKIQAPLTIDHTKQAAIRLMTRHTPKKRTNAKVSGARTPSLLVRRQGATPARRPTRASPPAAARSPAQGPTVHARAAPPRTVVSSDVSTYSVPDTSLRSPSLHNPKKSSLKNSSVNGSARKFESIKFDLSNLEDGASVSVEMSTASDAGERSGDELSLRYPDSSPDSPGPRSPAHSRSGRILEKTLGTNFTLERSLGAPAPPPRKSYSNKSTRGALMVSKVLQTPDKSCSYKSTGSLADLSWDNTARSAHSTSTSSKLGDVESYSVIDLISMDSSDPRSVYSSASGANSPQFCTPQASTRRGTRSLGAPRPPAASTPAASVPTPDYFHDSGLAVSHRPKAATDSPPPAPHDATYNASARGRGGSPLDIENIPEITLNSTRHTRPRSTPPAHGKHGVTRNNDVTEFSPPNEMGDTYNISDKSRTTKSFSTLKDSSENITSNISSGTRISKSRRSRSGVADTSPVSVASSVRRSHGSSILMGAPSSPPNGMSTPEKHSSPEVVSTPVLSIQGLLNSSRVALSSRRPRSAAGGRPARKAVGGRLSALRKRPSLNSRSFTFGASAAMRSRHARNATSCPGTDGGSPRDDGDMTPKKTIKLVYEAVKNKHSTAKRPKSIRSVLDDLNDSDIVKQLFNSPVKRKLSQSMMEFSKKQLMGDETTPPRKATRNTIALTGITTCDSSMERTPAITPDVFVSPLTATCANRRDVSLKLRRWREGTAETTVLQSQTESNKQTHRKSVKNDLTRVSGIKSLFARSPRNRLSDVRIKELFTASPESDLRRIPKLRLLFQELPESDLRDVSGVRALYRNRSPANDLRHVSGVGAIMRRRSPRNELDDVSGIEELFSERQDGDADAETSFDLLMGRQPVKAYPRAKSLTTKLIQKPKTRMAHSLLTSFALINDNVEDWLENELRKRTHKESPRDVSGKGDKSTNNANTSGARTTLNKSKSKSNLSRELLKLTTETVEGSSPVLARRGRSTALAKTSLVELKKSASEIYGAHMLPIKKRSVVETSRSRGGGGGPKSSLPIKKRAVQHSTPVRREGTAARLARHEALALVRVSPIPLLQHTLRHDDLSANNITSIQEPKERMKRKTLQTRNTSVGAAAANSSTHSTTKKLSVKQQTTTSPVQVKTRSRRTNLDIEQSNVKRRRTSIVVKKKPPSLSPKSVTKEQLAKQKTKPAARTSRRRKPEEVGQDALTTKVSVAETRDKRICMQKQMNEKKGRRATAPETPIDSPPRTRTMRTRRTAAADKVHTPKIMTRTKVLKRTVVVTKPSSNLKTRPTANTRVNASDRSPVKNIRRTRKTNANNSGPPAAVENNRGRKGKTASVAAGLTANKKANAKNNLSTKGSETGAKPRRGRKVAQKNVQNDSKVSPVQKRATRRTVNVVVSVNKNSRGEATAPRETKELPKRRAANKGNTEIVDRGSKRKTANERSPSKTQAPSSKGPNKTIRAGVSNEESAQGVRRATKARQGRARAAADGIDNKQVTERRGRNRNVKMATSVETPAAVGTARRRNTTEHSAGKRGAKDAAKQKIAAARNVKRTVRSKAAAEAEPRAPATRKRKADVDTSAPAAKAGPPAPKTRRAAARASTGPRQAAARSRRR